MNSARLDVAAEIIRACEGLTPTLTLLKGISIGEQFSPEPYLRPMGDIDILSESSAAPLVEARLLELGYRPTTEYPRAFYETHHHLRPLVHGRTRIWVEIHRGLFPPGSALGSERVFSVANVRAELRPSTFRNHSVYRLSDEFQLVYIPSHSPFGLRRVAAILPILHLL